MNYIMKPKIIVFEFVFKCIIFILFVFSTVPLMSLNLTISIMIDTCLLLGLLHLVRSLLWNVFGKDGADLHALFTIDENGNIIQCEHDKNPNPVNSW